MGPQENCLPLTQRQTKESKYDVFMGMHSHYQKICTFIRRLSWQIPCLTGTVMFQTKWGRAWGWEKKRLKDTEVECKRQSEWPLFFYTQGRDTITCGAVQNLMCTRTQSQAQTAHTHTHTHRFLSLFWAFSAFTRKVKSWIKAALISLLIMWLCHSEYSYLSPSVSQTTLHTLTSPVIFVLEG